MFNYVLFNFNTGHSKSTAPKRYVIVDPKLQKAMLAKIGPRALANAPKERKMPITIPFCCSVPYCETKVIMQGTTIAVAKKI